jgi:hypothetical protein
VIGCFFGWEDKLTAVEHSEELLEESRKIVERVESAASIFSTNRTVVSY